MQLYSYLQCHYGLAVLFCMCCFVFISCYAFVHLLLSTGLLSMMSLVHIIPWLLCYWAHPIANDAFAAGLASKVIYYSVNCNIRVNFCLKFLPPQSTLAPIVEVVPTSTKMFFCPLDLPIRRPWALPQESSRADFWLHCIDPPSTSLLASIQSVSY